MVPIFATSVIYILFFPAMKFCTYKTVLILFIFLISVILAIRVKNKIVASWLGILISYQLKPRYYLFNKNDLTNRIVDLPIISTKKAKKEIKVINTTRVKTNEISLSELIKMEDLVDSGKVALRYQFDKKGF
jgi:hypothetical protein